MIQFAKKTIRDLPYQTIARFKSLPVDEALLLFCDPRGGSTWLAESLNQIPRSLIIDEPLHLNNTKAFRQLNFSWRQYIPEDTTWTAAQNVFEKLLKGNMMNAGLCYRNSILETAKAKQLIFKIIRGKALLPWLVGQFNFKYKPIVVVRNPFALVASQMKHGAWNYEFQSFQLPDSPHNEFYSVHLPFLLSLTSKEEQLTAFWCLTNNVVLRHPENNRSWITYNYEDLILDPQKYFQQLFEIWQLPLPSQLWDSINKPSSTTIGKKTIHPEKLLSDWKNQLSEEQIEKIKGVLQYFKVDYYTEDIRPVIPANQVHLSQQ